MQALRTAACPRTHAPKKLQPPKPQAELAVQPSASFSKACLHTASCSNLTPTRVHLQCELGLTTAAAAALIKSSNSEVKADPQKIQSDSLLERDPSPRFHRFGASVATSPRVASCTARRTGRLDVPVMGGKNRNMPNHVRDVLRLRLALDEDLLYITSFAPDPRGVREEILAKRTRRVVPCIGSWRRYCGSTWEEALDTWPGNGLFDFEHLDALDDFTEEFKQAKSRNPHPPCSFSPNRETLKKST